MEAMAFFSVCDLVSNTNIWTQGERGEKGLIVNPQPEPNKEELSKPLPFCYILQKGKESLAYQAPPMGQTLERGLLGGLPHCVLTITLSGRDFCPCFYRGNCGFQYLGQVPEVTQLVDGDLNLVLPSVTMPGLP